MHLTEILPAKYIAVNIEEVLSQKTHLSSDEHAQLLFILFGLSRSSATNVESTMVLMSLLN
jgi:hypothetical protein